MHNNPQDLSYLIMEEIMSDNIENLESQPSVKDSPDNTVDYISAINELKNNTVSKEEYEQVVNDNKKLLSALIEGGSIEQETPPVDINQLRSDLFNSDKKDLNNLDFVTKSLQLRKAIIDGGGVDPFVPQSRQFSATSEDFDRAENVAKILQDCVDYAEGNPEVFTDQLKRYIN